MDVEHVEKAFVFAGMGARNGLHAALMVEAGFRGVRESFDHPDGWLRAGAFAKGDANVAYLIEKLNERTELTETAFKRYPVGGPTQPAIHGLLELLPKIDRNSVQSVRIEMPGRWQAFRDAAMPALNLRYTTSLILLEGKLDFVAAQSLERMATDAKVKALMERVTIVHDPKQEAARGQPRTESARVIVTENGGKRHEIYVPYVVGFPSHPMSRDEVEAKALELMAPRLGAARARQVVARVRTLESMSNARELIELIAA
jgi:2-methylcitrate dehydratase PrpD